MNLPDSFPKRFTINLTIDMRNLMEASICDWGKILATHLQIAENTAVEQIKDYRIRQRCFEVYGVDVGEGFKFDYNYAWVTTDDDVIQLLRLDFLPLSKRALDAEIDFQDGKYEEVEKNGETFLQEVKK